MSTPKRILLIEDDTLMIRVFQKQFTMEGFEVESITNGTEALARLNSLTDIPSAIVLDIMIPEVNGFDILSAYRKDDRLNTVPIFILTNLSEKDEERKALERGATKYFIKSEHDPSEIASEVQKHLS